MSDAERSSGVRAEARALSEGGNPAGAIDLCRGALRDADADLLAYLASLEQGAGLYTDSRKHFGKAYDMSPSAVMARDLAWAYVFDAKPGDAHRVLDRALRRWADSDVLIGAKAELLHHAGESDEAFGVLETALDREPNDPSVPIAFSFIAPGKGLTERAITLLRSAIDRVDFDQELRTYMRFRVGSLLDKEGRYDEAWAEFEHANSEVAARFDPDRFDADVDRLISDWDEERIAMFMTPASTSTRPIFIVGVPRSGTTLCEQILGAHPRVHPGGERSVIPQLLTELAGDSSANSGVRSMGFDQRGVDRMALGLDQRYRAVAPRAQRVTDKLPDNIMHLGLISMLLPAARVVVCMRDPLDTCLSCYFQHFRGGIDFAYDLTHLGRYAQAIHRLSDHWQRVLPSPIFELSYERLVGDQEGVTRELLGFLGLDWDKRCLRFYEGDRMALTASVEQVRRPLNSASVGRWKHYEAHLGPLREALEDPSS